MSVRSPVSFMEKSQNKSECLQIESLLFACVFLSCLVYSDYFVYTMPAPRNSWLLLYWLTLSTEHRQCFLQA